MRIIYALENLNNLQSFGGIIPNSIYLGGYTPKVPSPHNPSWRFQQGLPILEKLGFNGTVIVPEYPLGGLAHIPDHTALSSWEGGGVGRSVVVVFWYPRQLTNQAEFAAVDALLYTCLQLVPEKMIVGIPSENTKQVKPLQFMLNNRETMSTLLTGHSSSKVKVPQFTTLEATLAAAVNRAAQTQEFHH